MFSPSLKMWEFETAPNALRVLVPAAYRSGWIALVLPQAKDIADFLLRWKNGEHPIFSAETAGGTILAGLHPSPSEAYVGESSSVQ